MADEEREMTEEETEMEVVFRWENDSAIVMYLFAF